jgi:hypothetical protein
MRLKQVFSFMARLLRRRDIVGVREELITEWWMPGGKHHRRVYHPHSPTNTGVAAIAGLAGNVDSQVAFTYLALGTDATAAAVTQTALIAEITDTGLARHTATVSRVQTTVANDTLQLVYTWTASGVKILREIGILNAASTGIMASRIVYDAITTSNGMQVQMTHKLQFATS